MAKSRDKSTSETTDKPVAKTAAKSAPEHKVANPKPSSKLPIIGLLLAVVAILVYFTYTERKDARDLADDSMASEQTASPLPTAAAADGAETAPVTPETPAAAEPAEEEVTIDTSKSELIKPMAGDHLMGDEIAPVTIIEYASLSCSHCAAFQKETFPELQKKYIETGKVQFIFRHFPLNEPALRAAMLTECSGDKFHTFVKVLFQTQEKWAYDEKFADTLRTTANLGGIASAVFDNCIANKDIEGRIVNGMERAAKELGVDSTPTLFVNGQKANGFQDIDTLSKLIDKHLP